AHFAPAAQSLGISNVEFSIPEGTSGDFSFTIPNQTYQKAETIWMQLVGGAYPPELEGASSLAGPLQINPGAPARLIATASPTRLAANSMATISALVTDAAGNGTANVDVSVQIQQGSGRLRVAGLDVLQTQAATNASGSASFAFASGRISETNKALVWTLPPITLPSAEVSILTSLLGDRDVAAYPSPVAITQRPLTIEYRLDFDSDVLLRITDLFGREIWRTSMSAGSAGGLRGLHTPTPGGRGRRGRGGGGGGFG
ncbi:MAG TPA: hypothetical protein DEB40_00170, partial [Elusimicrobia bacterium]|nr:hypothetical protein [Elusimicrobiota bacterium]